MTDLFLAALTLAVALGSALVAGFCWPPAAIHLLVASFFYLAGTIAVTMACNVPLNNALAGVDPDSAAGAHLWARYLSVWTAWNHVRTAAPLLAAAVFILTLR